MNQIFSNKSAFLIIYPIILKFLFNIFIRKLISKLHHINFIFNLFFLHYLELPRCLRYECFLNQSKVSRTYQNVMWLNTIFVLKKQTYFTPRFDV